VLDRCWEPKILKKISRHYKTNKVLPDKMIKKIVKRYVGNPLLSLLGPVAHIV
jgi:Zn-dependent oligopeptidase